MVQLIVKVTDFFGMIFFPYCGLMVLLIYLNWLMKRDKKRSRKEVANVSSGFNSGRRST